jgi:dipeptidyl aminopeptidase/acylaminoacyl peptidase
VPLDGGEAVRITERYGGDAGPALSPDGRWLAWTGNDENRMSSQLAHLYVWPLDGGEIRALTPDLDRSIDEIAWTRDGVVFSYDQEGERHLALASLDGERMDLAVRLQGATIGRPYTGGGFSAAANGTIAYQLASPERPPELAVRLPDGVTRVLTDLHDDLAAQVRFPVPEALWVESSHDGRRVHAWVLRPPEFDPAGSYPLILEIHGGPHAAYGPQFSPELQLFAAAGYVVVYANPRGSTSYGDEFANLIHHAYPSQDHDDLMSVVDAVLAAGSIDASRLYVTGGSGGGVLTAWIVGKTDRFRAAVVAKPVINWLSFCLTADFYAYFTQWWFASMPWEDPDAYWKRSPLSLVGNVSTPTMLLTGEADYRTPISESEQYYQALKLRGVDTAMVRIPGASHGIASRPSRLLYKVACVLGWFEKHGGAPDGDGEEDGEE